MRKFVLILLVLGIFLNLPQGKKFVAEIYDNTNAFFQGAISNERNPAKRLTKTQTPPVLKSPYSAYPKSTSRRREEPTSLANSPADSTRIFGVNYKGEYQSSQGYSPKGSY